MSLATSLRAQVPDAATLDFNALLPLIAEQKFAEAIPKLEEILKKYPASPIGDAVRLNLGLAYLFDQKYKPSVEAFAKILNPPTALDLRDGALFFTGMAQAFQGFTLAATDAGRKKALEDAAATFAKHLEAKDFAASPYREEALYRRAQVFSVLENFDSAHKTLDQLLSEFGTSPNRADYLLLRGSCYAVKTFRSFINDKKTKAEVMPVAQKALDTFKEIRQDGKFVVIGNDASLQAAELLYLLGETPQEWTQTIQEYREVRTKGELIPIQEELIDKMRKELPKLALARKDNEVKQMQLRLNKERERLDTIKERPDPAVQAMAQIGSCYLKLRQVNEARILLRRAKSFAHADQKKNLAFQIILTYAIQGLAEEANKEFADYQKDYASDAQADNISVLIGTELMKQKEWQAANDQFQKSLKDYPKGRFVDVAVLQSADCLTKLDKGDEAIKVLQDFVAKNAGSDKMAMAQRNLGQAQHQQKKFEEAAKTFKELGANAKATDEIRSEAIMMTGNCYNSLKRYDEAIKEWQDFRSKFPTHVESASTLYRIGLAQMLKGDGASALATFDQLAKDFGKGEKADIAALGVYQSGQLHERTQKFPEMIAAYERVIQDFPASPYIAQSRSSLAKYFEKNRKFDEAAKHYEGIVALKDPKTSPWGQYNLGSMWIGASKVLGAFSALNEDDKKSWNGSIDRAEKSLVQVLKKFPASNEAGVALQTLVKVQLLRVDSGLLTQEKAESYFAELAKEFPDSDLNIRIQLAGVGVPYEKGNIIVALKAYKAIIEKNPKAVLSADDYNRYGSALLANKEYEAALAVFKRLEESYPADAYAQANATYGQGAALLLLKKLKESQPLFDKLNSKFPWSDKILEAKLGLGAAAEESGKPDDALGFYREIIQDQTPRSTNRLKAKATMGRGRIMEARGFLIPDPVNKAQPNAAAEYLKIDAFFESEKEVASEALFRGAQAYEKAGKTAEARKHYQSVTEKYKGTDWATKASEKLKSLPTGG